MKFPWLWTGALAIALSIAPAARAAERAVWVWEDAADAMVEDEAYARDAIAFLKGRDIGTVYLYADAHVGRSLLTERPELYRALLARMHGERIKVYAMLGSGHLNRAQLMRPERQRLALAMYQAVLDYNQAAPPDARFDGVNLDIEPHLLDEWDTERDKLLKQFLDMGQGMMKLRRQSGQTLPTGPSIPFWYDTIPLGWRGARKYASEHVIDLFDYVALMDYRDTAEGPDGIIEHGRDELDYAAAAGKRVVIGVEIAPNEIPKVTFDDNTEAELEQALATTARAYATHPGFGGFALHHLEAYVTWLVRQSGAEQAVTRP